MLSSPAGGGRDRFVSWMERILCQMMGTQRFEDEYPGVDFVSRDAIKTLHELLNVQGMLGLDYQSFFDLLQQSGEEKVLSI